MTHALAITACVLSGGCDRPDKPDELPSPTTRPSPSEEPQAKTSKQPPREPPVTDPTPPDPTPPVPTPPAPVPVRAKAFSGGPVEVDFKCGSFTYAFLRVGDKELVLEPQRKLKLKPGVYPLWMRAGTDDDDKWQKLPSLELEAGGPYEVRLRRPAWWELTDAGPPASAVTVLDPLPTAPSKDDPVASPLTGRWREVGRIPCHKGPIFKPADPIREFVIFAAGSFRVTWRAFESYYDYNGEYRLDLETKEFEFVSLAGNYVPDDIDARGRFKRKGRQLILKDMWLGSSRRSDGSQWGCGHVFEPR